MDPPEFLALEQIKQLSRLVVPKFLAKFSAKSSCCLFPTSLHTPIELFNEVHEIIDDANGEQNMNLAIYVVVAFSFKSLAL